MITRYGMCPGIKTGETEVQAEARQRAFYGDYRVVRAFFPKTLMGQENGSAKATRQVILGMSPAEDLVVSCKSVGPEFPARVAELKAARLDRATAAGVEPGRTRIIIYHEPENLTKVDYNGLWNAALPTLTAEVDWLEPGTCHTGYWAREVDSAGARVNDWRTYIPSNPAVQRLLRFVSVDLYPSAGRPTRAKPKYYEPPDPHLSPYGGWTEIGFCGILDEMLAELRSDEWPEIDPELEGGVAEINHTRPTLDAGWPTGFADSDPQGVNNAAWLNAVLQYAQGRYAFVTYFHKGGGILTDRTPQSEAELLRAWVRTTYDDAEPAPVPDPGDPQYIFGYEAGWKHRDETAQREAEQAREAGRDEVAVKVKDVIWPFL